MKNETMTIKNPKRTDLKSNDRVELMAQVGDNLLICVVIERTSYHVKDKWTFHRLVLIPSLLDSSGWDNMMGEKFCQSFTSKENAVAAGRKHLKEMSTKLNAAAGQVEVRDPAKPVVVGGTE